MIHSIHGCGQANLGFPKVFPNICSMWKQNWAMMLNFCIWVGFNRNNKLIQWFRVVLDSRFSIGLWSVGRGTFSSIAERISKVLVEVDQRFSACSRLSWSLIVSYCKNVHPRQKNFLNSLEKSTYFVDKSFNDFS